MQRLTARLWFATLLATGMFYPLISAAQDPGSMGGTTTLTANGTFVPDDWDGYWELTHENDWFFGSDRDLTSVLRFAYTLPNYRAWKDVPVVPDSIGELFDEASFIHDPYATVTAGMYLQQNMYTPANISLNPPNPNDHPYAGWLGLGVDLVRMTPYRRAIFEVNLGLVGPQSGAEALQKSYHSFNGANDPKGWGHQLRNEPVLQLTYRQDWRPEALTNLNQITRQTYGYDVIGHGLITAGNGWDYAAVGAMARFGYHLPFDFGPARPRLGEIGTLPYAPGGSGPSPALSSVWTKDYLTVYVCTGVEGRAVARDISLDGNTLATSPSVNKNPLVGEYFVGIVVQYGALHAMFMGNYETKTFHAEASPGQWRGVISVGWGF